ncbi:porin family protein [Seonamhaeicola sp.]|uniref:porin family protein n=1 Tax=Seonamhaeicola sp. TaxID=1912245 RepID=UPI002602A7D6|nr:porin family protein [Seonamhaeicola sp.]
MKKILLFAVLLVFSVYGFSQEERMPETSKDSTDVKSGSFVFQGVKYGVRAGYNISNLDFDGTPNMTNKHRNSFYFGCFANIGLSRTISLVPELQFSAEGANDEKLHLDYIQAPVLLRFRLSEKLHIAAGPQAGLKVHKFEDGINNMAYSAVGGVEYKISYMLFADARYTYGFRNIFDDASGVSAKNTNIQIGIGYKF